MRSLVGQALGRNSLRAATTVLAFALVYFCADFALNTFAFSDGWTIVWPLNGVTVAVLLMRPREQWAWTLVGIELGTGLGELFDNNTLGMELAQRGISATEVLVSACLLPPFATLDGWLRTPGLFGRFAAALLLGPGLSGLMAAALFHFAGGQPVLLAFNNWATADALGIAATMPLALALRSPQMRALFRRAELPRTLATLTLAFGGSGLIFAVNRYPLIFLLYPALLLVDSLLAFAGSAIAVVGMVLISVYLSTHAQGPFGAWPAGLGIPRDLAMQIFLGFHVVALFPASIMLMERRRMAEELQATNQRLTTLATLDGLTGIANRRGFDERYAREWTRAIRLRQPLAIAMIDLDNFKQYNDLYGHVAGDKCLRTVAEALQVHAQRPEDLVARFGGEEFALLLPHTSADGALLVVENVRAAVRALGIEHVGNPFNWVTVSIGYAALTPAPGDAQASLLQLADTALYQAKHRGRNRVETISTIEGLKESEIQVSATSRNRILRLLGGGGGH